MPEQRLVVVIPAGPRDDVEDTLRSVVRYSSPERIVVIDDTKGRGIKFSHENLTILPAVVNSTRFSTYGQLFVSLCRAYRYVAENVDFDLLLRLDADALLIGPALPAAASARFAESPRIGVLGAYRISPDGGIRDWTPAGRNIKAAAGLRGLRYPGARTALRRLLTDAVEYKLGEHVLGASVFYRRDIVQVMHERGYLDIPEFVSLEFPEDHLFGLIAAATGFETADFSAPGDPMAVRWKGLPAAPADLIKNGKLVTHSVRSWQGMDERAIRDYFAAQRS